MPSNYGTLVETSPEGTLSVYQKSMLGRMISVVNNHTDDVLMTLAIQSFIFEHAYSSDERYFAFTTEANVLYILDIEEQNVRHEYRAADLGQSLKEGGMEHAANTFVNLEWLDGNCVVYMQRKWREVIDEESGKSEDKFFYCVVVLNPDPTLENPMVTFSEGKTLKEDGYGSTSG